MLSTAKVDFSLFDTLGKSLSNQGMRILAAGESYETVKQDQRKDARLIENVLRVSTCPFFHVGSSYGQKDWEWNMCFRMASLKGG